MTVDWWLKIFTVSSCIGISITVVSIFGMLHYSYRSQGHRSRVVTDLMKAKTELQKDNADLKAKMKLYQDGRTETETSSTPKPAPTPGAPPPATAKDIGITTTYNFNGVKKVISKSGKESLYAGPEVEIFRKIRRLEKEQKVDELAKVCEEQIYKTPEWLTPHMFLGLAYANSGKHELAVKKFEFVLENAPNDPVYAQAEEFLKALKKEMDKNPASNPKTAP